MTIRRPGPARNNDAVARMIRIDHAGEYGAVHIYRGQRAVFGRLPSKTRIARPAHRHPYPGGGCTRARTAADCALLPALPWDQRENRNRQHR